MSQNDSIMFEYSENKKDITIKKWKLESFENYNFLVTVHPISTIPLLIDSVSSKNVHLTSYDDKIRAYQFQEQPKQPLEDLIGKWTLKENDTQLTHGMNPYDKEIKHLFFSQDSLTFKTKDSQIIYKLAWELSPSNKIIFLTGEKHHRILRILALNENELSLEFGYENFEKKTQLIFERE